MYITFFCDVPNQKTELGFCLRQAIGNKKIIPNLKKWLFVLVVGLRTH